MPVNEAKVTSSFGGEPKKIEGGWEFDIPASTKPPNAELTAYAALPSAFLRGSGNVRLESDFNPLLTIQLEKDTSARVRGSVVSPELRILEGAAVNVVGYESEIVTTVHGGFDLAAHAAAGQQVQLHAEMKGYKPLSEWVVAGGQSVTLILQRK